MSAARARIAVTGRKLARSFASADFYTKPMRASRQRSSAPARLWRLTLAPVACGGRRLGQAGRCTSTTAPGRTASPDQRCGAELPRFVRSLDGLRDQLARRPHLRPLPAARSEALQRAYARIDADEPAGCVVGVGVPAEKALNQNIEATNAWGDCLATVSCNTRSIEPKLQRKWALAAHQLHIRPAEPSSRLGGGSAGDVDRLGVRRSSSGCLGMPSSAVAVDVEALQAGSLERRQHLGFGEVALAVGHGRRSPLSARESLQPRLRRSSPAPRRRGEPCQTSRRPSRSTTVVSAKKVR